MIKKICIVTLILLYSCKEVKPEQKETIKIDSTPKEQYTSEENIEIDYKKFKITNWFKTFKTDTIIASEMYWKEIIEKDSLNKVFKADLAKSLPLKDKTTFFLKDIDKYYCLINRDFCKTISEPERAALGYLTVINGTLNRCHYDKTLNEECTMRTALNLDNECTEKFRSYLQFWFRNDTTCLKTINNNNNTWASSTHSGQSVYYYFTRITLKVKGNKIYTYFRYAAFGRSDWECSWTGKAVFLVNKDNIKLIEKKESEEVYVYF